MTQEFVTAANENLVRAFRTLAAESPTGEVRRFGPVTAACAGVGAPFFNRVFVLDDPPVDDLAAAVGWLAGRDLPYRVTVAAPVVEAVAADLADRGLSTVGEQPGMVLDSLDGVSPPDSVADIAEVTDPAGREAFSTVTASTLGMPPPVAERVDRAALAADGVRLFLGRVDGDPAASGLLIPNGDTAGVYSVGVVERFRRRGIGAAMTRAVLRAGREADCRMGVLQSSEMGYPLYDRLGFETVVTYHQFGPADASTDGSPDGAAGDDPTDG